MFISEVLGYGFGKLLGKWLRQWRAPWLSCGIVPLTGLASNTALDSPITGAGLPGRAPVFRAAGACTPLLTSPSRGFGGATSCWPRRKARSMPWSATRRTFASSGAHRRCGPTTARATSPSTIAPTYTSPENRTQGRASTKGVPLAARWPARFASAHSCRKHTLGHARGRLRSDRVCALVHGSLRYSCSLGT